ncbi:hypothetical protein F5B18DRAFT_535640 [Nemania serpens]|nr:hypothetical protein F5B18DRAFT_535640 [Nemania serpens]
MLSRGPRVTLGHRGQGERAITEIATTKLVNPTSLDFALCNLNIDVDPSSEVYAYLTGNKTEMVVECTIKVTIYGHLPLLFIPPSFFSLFHWEILASQASPTPYFRTVFSIGAYVAVASCFVSNLYLELVGQHVTKSLKIGLYLALWLRPFPLL